MITRLCCALGALLAPIGGQGTAPHLRSGSALVQQLDQYDRGEYDQAVEAALANDAEVRVIRQQIERDAAAWIASGGVVSVDRRRVVVAAFVIDVARGIYSGLQAKSGLGPLQSPNEIGRLVEEVQNTWGALRPMVEWACALLRQAAVPAPLEREWFLASVQLFRDFGDADVRPVVGAGLQREYGQAPGHLGHSRARFPGEPWFRLMVAERQTNQLAGVVRARRELNEAEYTKIEWLRTNPDVQSAAKDRSVEYAYLADLRRARQDLLPLAAAPAVRARVHLNLGGIALSFAQRDLARRYLDDVAPWTSNPCLTYLGYLLRGRIDELSGSPTEAERSFRAALNVVPRAQSATLALAALLWLHDRPAEATAIVEDAFSGPSVADDPWTAFQKVRHCTEWHQFIADLRVGLRR